MSSTFETANDIRP